MQNPAVAGLGIFRISKRADTTYRRNYPPILYMPVPHVGHLPFIAGFPFFIVTLTALGSSLLARHLTQYILAIIVFTSSQKYYLRNIQYALISTRNAQTVNRNVLNKSDFTTFNSATSSSVMVTEEVLGFWNVLKDSVSRRTWVSEEETAGACVERNDLLISASFFCLFVFLGIISLVGLSVA